LVEEGRHSGGDVADGHGRVILLIDAANVVGSRPNGWWRDRAGASRSLVERVRAAVEAGRLAEPVVVVLEGDARGGAAEGESGGVTVVHASGSGDDSLVALASEARGGVMLVSADRDLRRRADALGAAVAGPGWLLTLLDG
jgi:formylmethanofuran dehydrogenase subunit C